MKTKKQKEKESVNVFFNTYLNTRAGEGVDELEYLIIFAYVRDDGTLCQSELPFDMKGLVLNHKLIKIIKAFDEYLENKDVVLKENNHFEGSAPILAALLGNSEPTI